MGSSDDNKELVRSALLNSALKLSAGFDGRGRPLAWLLDCRELSLHGHFLRAIAELLWPLVESDRPTLIAGPTVSADPLVSALLLLADSKGKPLNGALVRPIAKTYGLRRITEGPPILPEARAVIVDDVLAQGSSIARTHSALRGAGAMPVGAVSLVDLEIPSRTTIENLNYSSVFKASELGLVARQEIRRSLRRETLWEFSSLSSGASKIWPLMTKDFLVLVGDVAGIVVVERGVNVPNMAWTAYPTSNELSATLRADEVVTVSRSGLVAALELRTRTIPWTLPLGGSPYGAVTCTRNDHVVVASTFDRESLDITRFAPARCEPTLHRSMKLLGMPIEVVPHERGFVVAATGAIYSLRLDLTMAWGRRWKVQSNVVVDGANQVAYVLTDNALLALNLPDGTRKWSRPIPGHKASQLMAIEAGIIFAAQITVAAVNANGCVIWVRSVGATIVAGPTAVGRGLVAVADRLSGIHVLRASDGALVSSRSFGSRIPISIVADTTSLVMTDAHGGALAVGISDLLATDQ